MSPHQTRIDDLLTQAHAAIRSGDSSRAAMLARAVLQIDPANQVAPIFLQARGPAVPGPYAETRQLARIMFYVPLCVLFPLWIGSIWAGVEAAKVGTTRGWSAIPDTRGKNLNARWILAGHSAGTDLLLSFAILIGAPLLLFALYRYLNRVGSNS